MRLQIALLYPKSTKETGNDDDGEKAGTDESTAKVLGPDLPEIPVVRVAHLLLYLGALRVNVLPRF